jgi:hypothetical protein
MEISKTQQLPNLRTILMVEEVIKNSEDSIITIPEIKRNLPKKVNHTTLMKIIEYLDESNKICISIKGITWIVNDNPRLKEAIKNAKYVF